MQNAREISISSSVAYIRRQEQQKAQRFISMLYVLASICQLCGILFPFASQKWPQIFESDVYSKWRYRLPSIMRVQHAAATANTQCAPAESFYRDEYPIIDAVQNPSWWFFCFTYALNMLISPVQTKISSYSSSKLSETAKCIQSHSAIFIRW